MKYLAVFDFDDTILNDNSDTAILALVGRDELPQEIKSIQFREGWTAFMQGVFTYLYEKGVTTEAMAELVRNLPAVDGMVTLIKELSKRVSYDLIIISDSNSLFIKYWLEAHDLDKCFKRIFTNPVEIVDGLMKISPYHYQNTCKLSTSNLCKGQIMEEFIQEQEKKGVFYESVVYTGDGVNDFCPILRLKVTDLICIRRDYKLSALVTKAKSGTSLDNSGKPHVVKAEFIFWETGDDIWRQLKAKKMSR